MQRSLFNTAKPLDFRNLPPLKALKGFESTARLQSFRKAAKELNLSHPAISHQIRALEQNLGVSLFIREGRQAILTNEGQYYYPIVREVLQQLIRSSETIRRSNEQASLRVQTYISVSIRWLSHRLPRYRAQHPSCQLHLLSSIEEQHFDEAIADIGLVFCRTPPAKHLHWQPLIQPKLIAVCSPSLIKGEQALTPEQLLQYPLLTITSEAWQWHDWFASAGIDQHQTPHTISVDSTAIALELAMDGQGITLVNGPFADKDINAGRLMHASNHSVEGLGEWGLICRQDRLKDSTVQNFIQWLQADVDHFP